MANTGVAVLKKPVSKEMHIEVNEVYRFAYGQYDDGGVDIWAAGQAGWFAIEPSRGYQSIFQSMIEAVKALYFLADTYKEVSRRKNGKLPGYADILNNVGTPSPLWYRLARAS